MDVNDEMLAAYIDGNTTPLENIVIDEAIGDESITEVIDLTKDCTNLELMADDEILPLEDIVKDIIRRIQDYQDLKTDLDKPEEKPLM